MIHKIGILDPTGTNNNPFTNSPYSSSYKELAKVWSKLLTYTRASDILNALETHNVILISSGTGSGKSVLVPKFVLHFFGYDKKIVMTLPKRAITKAAAEFAAKTLDVQLGTYVGYKYRGSPKDSYSDKTKLLFATDGTVVSKLMKDENLSEFNAVIIDEAHERKIQIDFLLYMLKNTLQKRPDFKLIIMSATIDETIFKTYYKKFNFISINIQTTPNFPVKSVYLDKNTDNYLAKSFDLIKEIVASKKRGDIIVFVPSIKDTKALCSRVREDPLLNRVFCVEFYSGQDAETQTIISDKELYKKSIYDRKLIIATDIAESSLTIDGIIFVIDSGKSIVASYNPSKRAKIMEKIPITKSQVTQRAGRAGRTEPGICYHLYTQEYYDKMAQYPDPLIIKSNIMEECFRLISMPSMLTVKNLTNAFYNFIEPPEVIYVNDAILSLRSLALLDREKILPFGLLLAKTRLDINMSVALAYAVVYDCLKTVVKICKIYTAIDGMTLNLFSADKQKTEQLKRKFKNKYGDLISLLKIYNFLQKHKNKWFRKWCAKQGFNYNVVRRMFSRTFNLNLNVDAQRLQTLKDELIKVVNYQKHIADAKKIERVLCCFYFAFAGNLGIHKKSNIYIIRPLGSQTTTEIKINRESFMNNVHKKPKIIFYTERVVIFGASMINFVSKLPKIINIRTSLVD